MVEDFKLDKEFKYPTLYGDNVREQWKNLIFNNFQYKLNNNQLRLPSLVKSSCEKYFLMNKQPIKDECELEIYNSKKRRI